MALLIAFNFLSKKEDIEEPKENLTLTVPNDTVLNDHIQPEIIEQPTILQNQEDTVIQKETPEIVENIVTESIYEESKPMIQKKINPDKMYTGGISN
jgi:hypothetical protein